MLRPKRSLGQVFLSDKNLLRKTASLCEVSGKAVIEIGAGDGRLTELLAEEAEMVYAVEMDDALCSLLGERFDGIPNVMPLHRDARSLDLSELASRRDSDEKFRVVGNLPYCSFVEIVLSLMKQIRRIEDIRVMSQKELATRLTASHGSSEYGRLSVVVQSRADVKRLLSLPAAAFWPRPKVDSTLIQVRPHDIAVVPGGDFGLFESFVGAAFAQRRKKLLNSLSGSADFSAYVGQIREILENLALPITCRAQDIPVEKYHLIVKHLAAAMGMEWSGQEEAQYD